MGRPRKLDLNESPKTARERDLNMLATAKIQEAEKIASGEYMSIQIDTKTRILTKIN